MRKRGIFIGVENYHLLGKLKYARRDAEVTCQEFQERCGFEPGSITLMTCQSEGALIAQSHYIEAALENLRQEELEQDEALELLVFGFWGHGYRLPEGKRCLCGVEAMENRLTSTTLPAGDCKR